MTAVFVSLAILAVSLLGVIVLLVGTAAHELGRLAAAVSLDVERRLEAADRARAWRPPAPADFTAPEDR